MSLGGYLSILMTWTYCICFFLVLGKKQNNILSIGGIWCWWIRGFSLKNHPQIEPIQDLGCSNPFWLERKPPSPCWTNPFSGTFCFLPGKDEKIQASGGSSLRYILMAKIRMRFHRGWHFFTPNSRQVAGGLKQTNEVSLWAPEKTSDKWNEI